MPNDELVLDTMPNARGRSRRVLAGVLGCGVILAAAAGSYWCFRAAGPDRQVPAAQPRAKQAASPPVADAAANDAGGGAVAANAPASREAGPETRLAPISEHVPGAVYSGTLGMVTRLQAGAEIARAELNLREVQARMAELDRRVREAAAPVPNPGVVAASVEAAAAPAAEATQDREPMRLAVASVRGGASLEAVIVSAAGRHVVRLGDSIPDAGVVTRLDRGQVAVDGRVLPWR